MTRHRWSVGAERAGARLDKFLAGVERLGSRSRAIKVLERGKVSVNGTEATIADAARRLAPTDEVIVWMDRPGTAKARPRPGQRGPVRVVFEDDHLIVVNKPAGVLTVPLERNPLAPSVYAQIVDRLRSHGKARPFVVHRIDQDTSGLAVFAKDAETQQALVREFKRREPERVYLAAIHGCPEPDSGTWRDYLVWDPRALIQKPATARDPRATEAVSDYRVVERFDRGSLIEVRLRTGRRNQIRIQAQIHGHPLIGEDRYVTGDESTAIPFARQALHAYRLSFTDPNGGRRLEFEAPLPPDFLDLLARLRSRRRRREPS